MAGALAREAASFGSAGTIHQSTKMWPFQCGSLTSQIPNVQLRVPRRGPTGQ